MARIDIAGRHPFDVTGSRLDIARCWPVIAGSGFLVIARSRLILRLRCDRAADDRTGTERRKRKPPAIIFTISRPMTTVAAMAVIPTVPTVLYLGHPAL